MWLKYLGPFEQADRLRLVFDPAALRGKAAVNAPHSRRFATFRDARPSRQRLEGGGFSTAFGRYATPKRAPARGLVNRNKWLPSSGVALAYCAHGMAQTIGYIALLVRDYGNKWDLLQLRNQEKPTLG